MLYSVLIHPNGDSALVSRQDADGSTCLIAFASEGGEWSKHGITWFCAQPEASERAQIVAEARLALFDALEPAEPVTA